MKSSISREIKQKRTRRRLRELGLSWWDMLKPETFYISNLLHSDEKLLGAVCGRIDNGQSALLVVTNLRIIYLNQIPLFKNMEEMNYDAVDGVSSEVGRLDTSVTLHTSIREFTLHAVNSNAASKFVDSVERVSIDRKKR